MPKLFDINEATINYFGSNQLKTKLILNYDHKDIVVFDKECLITNIPNTIEDLCLLHDGFKKWYENAVVFNKKYQSDYWMIMKFYIDLIIDTTLIDTTLIDTDNNLNLTSTYQSKITYSNKIKPYHDELN
jgi:hypothetical protein